MNNVHTNSHLAGFLSRDFSPSKMRSQFCWSLLVAATLLLSSTRAQDPEEPQDPEPITAVLPDIVFLEGRAANEEVITIRDDYPISNGFAIFPGILGDLEPTVFEDFFRYGDNGRTIITNRNISRDDMAIALQKPHSPVEFVFTFYVVDVFTPIANVEVTIRIMDRDNNVPVFIGYETVPLHLPISEGSMGTTDIRRHGIQPATDNDEGINAVQNYTLLDTFDGLFSLRTERNDDGFIDDIRLELNEQLDREVRDQYTLRIRATEGNANPDSAILTVNITVNDVCDEPPHFPITGYFPTIEENLPAGTTILPNLTAIDPDILDDISYQIRSVCSHTLDDVDRCTPIADPDIPFNLDQETGTLTINQPLDREEFTEYEITIFAVDNCRGEGTATVTLTVLNVNDNPPSVVIEVGDSYVPEGTSIGFSEYFLLVEDPDYGTRPGTTDSRFTFHLQDNSTGMPMDTNLFQLDMSPLQIRLTQSLDWEETNEYLLVLNVTDWGTPNMSTVIPLPINVVDINDNPPILDPISNNFDIFENAIVNTMVVTVHAEDRDSFESGNGRVSYLLPDSTTLYPHQDLFAIDSLGRVVVNGTLDREVQDRLSVLVEARDNPGPTSGAPHSDFVVVNITLIDINDTPPTILTPPEVVNLLESIPENTVVFTASASDDDTPRFATLVYTLTSVNPGGAPFSINQTSGAVTLTSMLDYDTIPSYVLTLHVTDGTYEVTRTITVMVGDVNDERCRFDRDFPYMSTIRENRPENYHIVNITATDRDTEVLSYSINAGNERGSFRIDSSTGDIFTTRSLDHDVVSNYTLIVSCNDGSGIPVTTQVIVTVVDENDNIPQFINLPYNFTVSEGLPENTTVNRVRAIDSDSTSNARIRFSIVGSTPESVRSWFRLDENTGDITTTRVLDREADELVGLTNGQIVLNIQAEDMPAGGIPANFNTTLALIEITDDNDEWPMFAVPEVTIMLPENYELGRPFDTVIQATDRDIFPNNQIEYEISGRASPAIMEMFDINRDTGALRLLQTLDYETEVRHEFEVLAIDATMRNQQAMQTVIILVENVKENNITIVGFVADISIPENVATNGSYVVTQFTVTDKNQTPLLVNLPRLQYTIVNTDPSSPTELSLRNESTSSMLIVYVNATIDRENPPIENSETLMKYFNITVYDPDTSDQSHGSVSVILTVTVTDENDNDPAFGESAYTFSVLENNDVTTPIGQVTATDIDYASHGTPGITYTISNSNVPFTISPTGHIRSMESLDRDTTPQYSFTVVARDGGTPARSTSVSVAVVVTDENDNDPEFDSTQNRTFLVGEETSVGTIVATLRVSDRDAGLNGQVNLTIGDLESPHFRLESNGSIVLIQSLDREATPRHHFTVGAMDGRGRYASAEVTIVVRDYNDNPPVFNSVDNIIIPENYPVGPVFTTITADDADEGPNSEVRYAIGNYSLQQTFCMNQDTGEISLCVQSSTCGSVIDFERQEQYDVNIIAYDLGFPRHIVSKIVRIQIVAVNEYRPLFDRNLLMVHVDETQMNGVEVARIRAIDRDKDDQITYEVMEGDQASLLFGYDQSRGAIISNGILDFSTRSRYDLMLQARDTNNSMSHVEVVVFLNNLNNHAPEFDPASIPGAANQPILVPETKRVSSVVWTVRATDEDNNTHDGVSYHLQTPDNSDHFSIDSLTGEIVVSRSLDFETRQSYTLEVFARDTGTPQRTSDIVTLMISVVNENDELPTFTSPGYAFTVNENRPAGTTIGQVSAPDADDGVFGDVHYSLSFIDEAASELFGIDPGTGDISTLEVLDREILAGADTASPVSFRLRVEASDGGRGLDANHVSTDVVVTIGDLNDNAPQFSDSQYLIKVPPTQLPGTTLMTLPVNDPDQNGNNAHTFEIISLSSGSGSVDLDVTEGGGVRLSDPIPSSYLPAYAFTVRVVDSRDSSLRSETRLELIIETSTDHHPVFNPVLSTIRVSELTQLNEVIFRVEDVASDLDDGNNGRLSYAFAESYSKFEIDSSDGAISLREMLDYETTKNHTLTVLASDGRAGTRRTATGTVFVIVESGNEYAPVFSNLPTHLTISHLPELNLEIFTAMATDRDEGADGVVRYNIFDSTEVFTIERETGILRNQGRQNSDDTFNLTIGAYDLGNPFRSSNTTILITLENGDADSRPRFVENPRTIMQAETDDIVGYLNTPLVTNPPAQSFHIAKQTAAGDDSTLIEMFDIVPGDGRLSLLAPLDYEQVTEYNLVIESRIEVMTQSGVRRMSDYLRLTLSVINVNDNLPLFSTVDDQMLDEDTPVWTNVFDVLAVDDDEGLEGQVSYDIVRGDSAGTFWINATTGNVFLMRPLDRESVSEYDLVIRAHDNSNQPQTSEITVHVTVNDVNDFATTYGGQNFSLGVYEFPHTQPRDRIVKLTATDEDEGSFLRYGLELVEAYTVSGHSIDVATIPTTFEIDTDSGVISVAPQLTLDRETVERYVLHVTATDRVHNADTYLTLKILDVNDHDPQISVPMEFINVREGQPAGTLVTNEIVVTDRDAGMNGWVKYRLGDSWPPEFSIDPLSGVIRTNDVIRINDYADPSIIGPVIVEDQGSPPRSAVANVHILIRDVNDHPPEFGRDSIVLGLSVSASVNTLIYDFNVTDQDTSVNRIPVMFSIPSYYTEVLSNFQIGQSNGKLVLEQRQPHVRSYNFVIHASNPLYSPRCVEFIQASEINVTVNVRPVNTGCPEFFEPVYTNNVVEEMSISSSLVTVDSSDPDEGDTITYSIADQSRYPMFRMDPQTGSLTLTSTLDRERNASYSLTVVATDDGFPPMSCFSTVEIIVLDINDHEPEFDSASYAGSVSENLPEDSPVLQVRG